jgi:hypothetical protein
MIIMQNSDAAAARSHIESEGLAKVIFSHEGEDSICVQYHPKGIKGGIMPELDSHKATQSNPNPITTRFSPWHACGKDYASYSAGMMRQSDLELVSVHCRLAAGDTNTMEAALQWERIFGVSQSFQDLSSLTFTNAQLVFLEGVEGEPEGLESITIAVTGEDRFNGILEKASKKGLCGDGWINMLGIKWYFNLAGVANHQSRL